MGKEIFMIIDQLNELINRGIVGLILAVIAFMLVFYLFGKDTKKSSRKKSR